MSASGDERLVKNKGKRVIIFLKNGFKYQGIIQGADNTWLELFEQTISRVKIIKIDEIADFEILGEGKA